MFCCFPSYGGRSFILVRPRLKPPRSTLTFDTRAFGLSQLLKTLFYGNVHGKFITLPSLYVIASECFMVSHIVIYPSFYFAFHNKLIFMVKFAALITPALEERNKIGKGTTGLRPAPAGGGGAAGPPAQLAHLAPNQSQPNQIWLSSAGSAQLAQLNWLSSAGSAHLARLAQLSWLGSSGSSGSARLAHLAQLSWLIWLSSAGSSGSAQLAHLAQLSWLR